MPPNPELKIEALNGEDASSFAAFTFPALRHFLNTGENAHGGDCIRLAARVAGQQAGLLLGALDPRGVGERRAELLSVYVAEPFRQLGIATTLIERFASLSAESGARRMFARYTTGKKGTEVMEHIFRKTAWNPPESRMLSVKCSHAAVAASNPLWFRSRVMPKEYQMVKWIEVSEAQRAQLRESQAASPWVPEDLMPFQFEEQGAFEPVTSLALLRDGCLCGWVVTHALSKDVVRYTCSFVDMKLQRQGRLFHILGASVARMPLGGFTYGIWTVPVWHKPMHDFTLRRFGPIAEYVRETRGVERVLP